MPKNKKSHKEERQTKQKNPHKTEKYKTSYWSCIFLVYLTKICYCVRIKQKKEKENAISNKNKGIRDTNEYQKL